MDTYDRYIESLRQNEYPQLQSTTYLDHAGTTLYAQSLIDVFSNDLKQNLYGNPHSASPSSSLSTQRVDAVREQVLKYFNADQRNFDVVFAANATAAVKLVLHAFEQQGFHYGYHRDCHTSIVGVRETALSSKYFESDEAVDRWIEEGAEFPSHTNSLQLFAYPAQSNMTGHRPDLTYSKRIRSRNKNVHVLLDAASYMTTGRLDFSDPDAAPDFTALSFYKIFGFPDLGALIVRKQAAPPLTTRRYFGGGTVDMIINSSKRTDAWHAMKTQETHEALEDGTLPFHNIIALGHAVRLHQNIFGSATLIRQHTATLIQWLYEQMEDMTYKNGQPLCKIYKEKRSIYGDPQNQGPIIAFNVLDQRGNYIGKSRIEQAAIACGIQLRSGGVCNPGGVASMLNLKPWELRRNFTEGMRCGDDLDVLGGKPTGVVRVSLGPMSCMRDLRRFVAFLQFWFLDGANKVSGLPVIETKWAGKIAAVEGLPADEVILSEPVDHEAVKEWEKEWFILSEEGYIVFVKVLKAQLFPENGVLKIWSVTNGDGCDVELWNTVYESGLGCPVGSNGRRSERCMDERINDWLSKITGVRCTLAKYRSRYLEAAGRVSGCVKTGCNKSFETKKELLAHLEDHARESENWIKEEQNKQLQTTQSSFLTYSIRHTKRELGINEQELHISEKNHAEAYAHNNNMIRRLLKHLKLSQANDCHRPVSGGSAIQVIA